MKDDAREKEKMDSIGEPVKKQNDEEDTAEKVFKGLGEIFGGICKLAAIIFVVGLLFYPAEKIEEKHSDGSISVLISTVLGFGRGIEYEKIDNGTYRIKQIVKGHVTTVQKEGEGTYYCISTGPLNGVVLKRTPQKEETFQRKDVVFHHNNIGAIVKST